MAALVGEHRPFSSRRGVSTSASRGRTGDPSYEPIFLGSGRSLPRRDDRAQSGRGATVGSLLGGTGFTSFKAYQWVSKDVLAALIDEAHRMHLTVTAHLRSVSCAEAAAMRLDNIEHGCGRSAVGQIPIDEQIAALRVLLERKVALTVTPT